MSASTDTTSSADGTPPSNPFCPPRLASNPHQPLRPWDQECEVHEKYYVDVDDAEKAYRHFIGQTDDLFTLVAAGRLVVVTGQQGCGKTSLINRCAWNCMTRLREHLNSRLVIADLTGECTDNQSVPDRANHVATMLIDHLEDLGPSPLDDTALAELRKRLKDSPARMYYRLSQELKRLGEGDPLALAVLLPPSADLVPEIVQYATFVAPRLLFFAESSYLDGHGEWRSRLPRSARATPIVLQVGPLRKPDFWQFALNRLRLHHGPGVPRVDQEVMDLMYQPDIAHTLEHVQKIMFGVYEDLLSLPNPPDRVTHAHINRYLMRAWRPPT